MTLYYNLLIFSKIIYERKVKTNRGNEKEKEKWIALVFPNLLFRRSWQSSFVGLHRRETIAVHLSKNAVRSIPGPRCFFFGDSLGRNSRRSNRNIIATYRGYFESDRLEGQS